MVRFALGMLCLIAVAIEPAKALDAERVLSMCEGVERGMKVRGEEVTLPNTPTAYQCWGFIGAIQDVSRIESAKGRALGACPPPELTTIDFLRSFTKYARTHRQELHLPAGVVAVKAIASSFPCK